MVKNYSVYYVKQICFAVLFCFLFIETPAQLKKFTLLHTSDEHSTLLPIPLTNYHPDKPNNAAVGGFARLATAVKEIKEKSKVPALLFSSGDVLGGSPFAWLILKQQSPELSLMQAIGYNAMAIGNHEFDYGPEVLYNYFLQQGYSRRNENNMSIISSNLKIPTNHVLKDIAIETTKIYTLANGLKIGVFALLGKGAYALAPYAEPVTISDPHVAAKKSVEELRKQGADVIVCLSHSGIKEDRSLAENVDGIDVILGGHDHITTPIPEKVNNTFIAHPGYYLQYLGKLQLAFDPQSKQVKLLNDNKEVYLQPLSSDIKEDKEVVAIIDQYTDSLNSLLSRQSKGVFNNIYEPVVYSGFNLKKDVKLCETTIGNFIADAMRIVGEEITKEKVHVAFQSNGLIRENIIAGTTEWNKDKFSLYDLLTISGLGLGPDKQPGYPMVSIYLTEKEIINVLEATILMSRAYADNYFLQVSGLKYIYDPGKTMWLKIPFINLPVPATMSVRSAFIYSGGGIQKNDSNYIKINQSGEKLYHVVSDYYLAAFLPRVGEVLPDLKIIFKNKKGEAVDIKNTIIMHNGSEWKVWQSVAQYAYQLKVMPNDYKTTQNRIVEDKGIPLYVWSISAIHLVVFLFFLLIKKLIKWLRRKNKTRKS